ncbi:MAG: tRNA pseudouridine(55) synthase TruB [Candidatus Peribacter sp.]|jgi:tRNA pseudouridine55 synthase|nr:tRNA pseudouridine(55) synthase TruB [Candidatus Peribacter sp.]MBT4392755.1 tRNA pseudouridine(55) synthase TruB [Candidatus Peribacter sp.]MBT4600628.1 tRNA pseudouridine(55) synthase TruB [Candidatus Peribacter sp.]MBT5148703.1 tRNA pseudouridine(55) synthase TruB [Candidatus Peribacter sp.]MBT5637702.1 tRNA pseudouridine(55) synthase TruB [Candidatus Peribacter sp.]
MRHGFLLIDKPEGPTSHDIVAMVRKALNERKVGHLGTLDPAAAGLMVLAVGTKALKVVELYNSLPKEYIADIDFGSVSATYDREGPIEEFSRMPGVNDPTDHEIVEAIRDRFLGRIDQVPPAASAVKVGGERAYRKMRQGKGVDLPTRSVEIETCDLLSYTYPHLQLRVACGSGTYIRSLANDLGVSMRIGGYLTALKRTRVGEWSLDDAVKTDTAKWADVMPLKEVLKDLERFDLSDDQFEDVSHGRKIEGTCKKDTIAWHKDLPVAILEEAASGEIKARKVL